MGWQHIEVPLLFVIVSSCATSAGIALVKVAQGAGAIYRERLAMAFALGLSAAVQLEGAQRQMYGGGELGAMWRGVSLLAMTGASAWLAVYSLREHGQ